MNWWMRVLQTLALPLGHVTIFGATAAAPFGAADEARTRYLHLGKVALYQMSYGRILITLFCVIGVPAKVCGEEEEFQRLLRRSCVQDCQANR